MALSGNLPMSSFFTSDRAQILPGHWGALYMCYTLYVIY